MSRFRNTAAMFVAVPALLLAGCDAADSPLTPVAADAAFGAAPAPRDIPGLDGEFVRLARQVPGFGGYYFDQGGDLNVVLTDLRQEPAARAALAAVARRGRGAQHAGAAGVHVRKGDYDFIELNGWRERARSALGIRGTVFLDTDETANRLRLGVSDPASTPLVEAELRRAGVPREAVIIEPAPAVRPFATLSDYIRPVVGGVQISFQKNTSVYEACTLGVNARYTNFYYGYQNVGSFLTNSHCTRTKGVVDSVEYLQGSSGIAREYHDPPFWTGGGCPSGRRCRFSDAALARYDAGTSWTLGAIARTYVNSTTIDAGIPSFQINGTLSHAQVGDFMEKVGAVTGWTRGEVTQSCVDVNWERDEDNLVSDITLFCQVRVDATGKGGDSGSPVFALNASGVTFAGILWGGDAVNFSFYYFSALDNLQNDFGMASLAF